MVIDMIAISCIIFLIAALWTKSKETEYEYKEIKKVEDDKNLIVVFDKKEINQ